MGCYQFFAEWIAYISRDEKIEGQISAYKSLSLEERSELHNLLYQRNSLRELRLLIYQVINVYATGSPEEREHIENWLHSINAHESLKEIQSRFVTNTLVLKRIRR